MCLAKKIKNTILIFGLISSLSFFSTYATTTSLNIQLTLTSPLTITSTNIMNFGTLAIDGGGTVYMSNSGVILCTGFISVVCPSMGSPSRIVISGNNNQNVNILYTNAILRNTSGTGINFVPSGPSNVTLNSTGSATLNIGGTITFIGNEGSGVYRTSNGGVPYTVTVNY